MTSPTDGQTAIVGGSVVTPDAVVPEGRVVVAGDRVVAVDEGGSTVDAGRRIDATGLYVLPGLVDLHGDDVERYLYPRDAARVRTGVALAACEAANLAAGVTTKFHAIAFEDVPDKNRSIDQAIDVARAIRDRQGVVDDRVHARCELTDPASVAAVDEAIRAGVPDLVSVMAHVPGEGQFDDVDAFARHYSDGGSPDPRTERLAERRGAAREETVRGRLEQVVAQAIGAGLPVASHDDAGPEAVERASRNGVDVSEYPITFAAARRAADLGLTTAMGAPNLVRGGSLWGNLDAREAVGAGVLDVLCSDYHPPSLLGAAFVDAGDSLVERVRRVSANPAAAVGLDHRGRVEQGARADVILVDPDPVPTVRRAFVAGSEVYRRPACQTTTGGSG